MKIEDAINHFKWKFTQSNSKASNKDKSSLNAIIRALNEQSNSKVNDNLNFCKLLMYNFRDMCIKNAVKNNYEFIEYDLIYSKLREALSLDANSHIEETFKELLSLFDALLLLWVNFHLKWFIASSIFIMILEYCF